MEQPTMWFPNRSDTNGPVQAQKRARSYNFGFKWKRNCTIRVAKAKALISFAVTAKLICAFVFAYADCWFSHEAAHIFVLARLIIISSQAASKNFSLTLWQQIFSAVFMKLWKLMVFIVQIIHYFLLLRISQVSSTVQEL